MPQIVTARPGFARFPHGTAHALVVSMTTTTLTKGTETITMYLAEGSEYATVRDADGNVFEEDKDVCASFIRIRISDGWTAS